MPGVAWVELPAAAAAAASELGASAAAGAAAGAKASVPGGRAFAGGRRARRARSCGARGPGDALALCVLSSLVAAIGLATTAPVRSRVAGVV